MMPLTPTNASAKHKTSATSATSPLNLLVGALKVTYGRGAEVAEVFPKYTNGRRSRWIEKQ